MEEAFETITEETAQGLIEAFDGFNKAHEEFEKAFNGTMQVYMSNCQLQAAGKFINYMEKYTNATFLTRWYWLRKARKANEALLGVIQFNEEFFKHKNIHEQERNSPESVQTISD